MKRTVAALTLLFGYYWPVALMSGTAVFFLLIGVAMGPGHVVGNVFALFSILWASTAFREFANNRRLTLLPGFRTHAVAALFAVAVALGAADAVAAVLHAGPAGPIRTGLLTFAIVSACSLLTQWGSTTRAPLLLQLLLVLFVVTYAGNEALSASVGDHAWAAALAALLGWYWLLSAVRRGVRLDGPHPMVRIEQTSGIRRMQWPLAAIFGVRSLDVGEPASPAGTLVRGASDGWVNRIGASLLWIVGFALLQILWLQSAAAVSDRWDPPWERSDPALGFLMVSFAGAAVLGPARFVDWPARLRYVWLRTPGDRAALWRMLERTIIVEACIVAVIAAGAAGVLFFARVVPFDLLLIYVAGCTTAMLLGMYAVMGMRISGASVMAASFFATAGWVPVLFILMAAGPERAVLDTLLFLVLVAAPVVRFATRRMFLRMDWCAVKPWREPAAARS